jgi:hypothetical protein
MKLCATFVLFFAALSSIFSGEFVSNHAPSIGIHEKMKLEEVKKRRTPPLGIDLRCTLGGGDELIEVISRVDKEGEKYKYTYTIKNAGKKKTWVTNWSVIDQAIGRGSNWVRGGSHLWILEPGKETKMTVIHEDSPEWFTGGLIMYDKNRHKGIEDWYKVRGVTIEGVQPTYYFQMAAGQMPGAIPRSMLPQKDD